MLPGVVGGAGGAGSATGTFHAGLLAAGAGVFHSG